MKVADLLELRRRNWQELEMLCDQMQSRRKKAMGAATISRFAALYRAACADLALADAYHLPPNTVLYLHRLVGRAHNQLYRSRIFNFGAWGRILFFETPQRIFNDRCVQFAFVLFWGLFITSAFLSFSESLWPGFANQVLGDQIPMMEDMFSEPIEGRSIEDNTVMASFYISHNTRIGLQCFAGSLLILPGLVLTIYNAVQLGASFGYMFRPDVASGANFRHFVTAHGPFELTAIVLSFGSGLRIGVSWLVTHGLTRIGSLRKAGQEALPMMCAAMLLFAMAAFIEGFISPSALPDLRPTLPLDLRPFTYPLKAVIALVCSGLLMFYFVVLGFPWRK